jgi:hypothetical protein
MFAAINSFLTRSSGYFLNKSLRFRSSASAYLNRTPATATNQKTWTWSSWIKRGTINTGTAQRIFNVDSSPSGDVSGIWFNGTTDTLNVVFTADSSGGNYGATTTAVFRDPAAWYHVTVACDTTQATNTDRIKIYVNGVIQATTGYASGYPTLNFSGLINLNRLTLIGQVGSVQFFDGEMAEVNFVDGYPTGVTSGTWAATNVATIFGASSIYNQWLPIKYAGTYGTNGFYLPFTNTTSTTTLVADSSGNANNWTPNNISLTAGSTYDSLTDVPTLTSETVANYAVLNPLDAATTTGVSSNGNLTWTNAAVTHQGVRGSIAIPATGAFYIEGTNVTANGAAVVMGFGLAASTVSLSTNMAGTSANSFNFYSGGGANTEIYAGVTQIATITGGAFAANDVAQIAVDVTNTKMWLGKNNVWYNSTGGTTGNPTTGANPTFTTSMAGLFFMVEAVANSINVNFGQQPFTYTAPTGFLPLNTFNI